MHGTVMSRGCVPFFVTTNSNLLGRQYNVGSQYANVTARFAAVGLNPGAAPACKIPGKLGLRVP